MKLTLITRWSRIYFGLGAVLADWESLAMFGGWQLTTATAEFSLWSL